MPLDFQLGIGVGPPFNPTDEKPPGGGVSKSPLSSGPTILMF